MKIFVGVLFLFLLAFSVRSQDYKISFAGSGASSSVDSVKVENLSQCTSLTMAGTDTLLLASDVGIRQVDNPGDFSMKVIPNPSPGTFAVLIKSGTYNTVTIGLWDLFGKMILETGASLSPGNNHFTLGGLAGGQYILETRSGSAFQSMKVISTATTGGTPSMVRSGLLVFKAGSNSVQTIQTVNNPKGVLSLIPMQFNSGDTLKLTGKSGIYRTVCMLFPISDQTVTFTFTSCTDADSNHYAVVQIGSQLWMQENLKTTKYRDGSDIPNVTDSAEWATITSGAYCNYHNLPEEGDKYGRLYNFYAVNDTRKICPQGWHVASHSEWHIMEKYLDNTVDTTAIMGTGHLIGRILKEGCETRWQYLDTTYGINPAGFTALCANFRSANGGWSLAPGNNHDTTFWTATAYTTGSAWSHGLRWCYSDIYVIFPMNRAGFSVRCVRDN